MNPNDPATNDRTEVETSAGPSERGGREAWLEILRAGRADEALRRYRETGAPDRALESALVSLRELQARLREREYRRAEALAADLNAAGLDTSGLDAPAPNAPGTGTLEPSAAERLGTEGLVEQLASLRSAADSITPYAPEAGLEALNALTHPLLHAEVETLRGTGLIFLNRSDEARAAFETALAQDAKHHRALTNLGNLALERGETDEAISLYRRALELEPDFANAHHNLGVAYRRKGQVGRSVQSLRRAQGASQRRLRAEAREQLRDGVGGPNARKYGRWLLYALLAVVAYVLLRSQGVI